MAWFFFLSVWSNFGWLLIPSVGRLVGENGEGVQGGFSYVSVLLQMIFGDLG